MIFLNRWIVTDLGLQSFGRLWQYYVSYFDFGFVRRAFIGTILNETGLNDYLKNPYVFGFIFYAINILILSLIILFYCLRNNVFPSWHGYAVIFFSPVFIWQSGYLTGAQDIYLLILAGVCTLYVTSWAFLTVFSVLGILTHELFAFMFPATALIVYFKRVGATNVDVKEISWMLTSSILVLSAFFLVVFFGVDVERGQFERLMAERLGIAAHQHPFWSGYVELFSTPKENITRFNALGKVINNFHYAVIPIAYASILAFAVSLYIKVKLWERFLVLLVLTFPMFVTFVAADFYRWVGMSANMSLLAILVFYNEHLLVIPKKIFLLILSFSMLAPFGAAEIERPFPAHQMVLEKVFQGTSE